MDILGNRKPRNKVPFLMYDANAMSDSLARRAEMNLLTLQDETASVGAVNTGNNLDERRLPRSIFAEQSMYGMGLKCQGNALDCLYAWKGLLNACGRNAISLVMFRAS